MSKESDLAKDIQKRALAHGSEMPWFVCKELARELISEGTIEVVQVAPPAAPGIKLPEASNLVSNPSLGKYAKVTKPAKKAAASKQFAPGGFVTGPKNHVHWSTDSGANSISANSISASKITYGQKVKVDLDGVVVYGNVELQQHTKPQEEIYDHDKLFTTAHPGSVTYEVKVSQVDWPVGMKIDWPGMNLGSPQVAGNLNTKQYAHQIKLGFSAYHQSQSEADEWIEDAIRMLRREVEDELASEGYRRTTPMHFWLETTSKYGVLTVRMTCNAVPEVNSTIAEVKNAFYSTSKQSASTSKGMFQMHIPPKMKPTDKITDAIALNIDGKDAVSYASEGMPWKQIGWVDEISQFLPVPEVKSSPDIAAAKIQFEKMVGSLTASTKLSKGQMAKLAEILNGTKLQSPIHHHGSVAPAKPKVGDFWHVGKKVSTWTGKVWQIVPNWVPPPTD